MSNNLRARLLTALVLIPLVLIFIFYAPPKLFAVFTALFLLLGAWEWTAFVGLTHRFARLQYIGLMLILLVVSLWLPIFWTFLLTTLWWIMATLLVAIYPRGKSFMRGTFTRCCIGILVLIPAWMALNSLHSKPHGGEILLFLLALVWGSDSGAYFIGRAFGKHTLVKNVSPGKTWEGFMGGIFTILLITIFVLWFVHHPYRGWASVLFLSVITTVAGVIGDLFESLMKREVGLKDSGSLFPGHGGVLDRVDSLTAAAPIYALGLMFIW